MNNKQPTTNNKQQNDLPQLPFQTSHAFIIGIDRYRDKNISPLKTAVNDAVKIAEVLQKEQDFNVHEKLLDAGRAEIEKLLKDTLPKAVSESDRVFFYYAGHGVAVEGEDGRPNGYLVPSDADAKNIAKTSVPMSLLYDTLNNLNCKHGLLVLDCCFSGAFRWSSGYRDLMNFGPETLCQEHFDRFVREPSWKVITSAAYDQKALDVLDGQPTGERGVLENGKHSPFAQYLFEGLAGKADVLEDGQEGDGVITAPELYEYICKNLVPASMELGEKQRQTPDFFPLSDKDRQGQFIFLNRSNRRHLPSIPLRNPYKGLQSFDMADSDLFFGRDQVIENLREKAAKCKLLVVAGASGTGKSSVIKAGLLPVLRDDGWRILPVVRPGADPLAALEAALKSLSAPELDKPAPNSLRLSQKYRKVSLRGVFDEAIPQFRAQNEEITSSKTPRDDSFGTAPGFVKSLPAEFLQSLGENKSVLLIDQYEELITQSSRKSRQQFETILQQLLEAAKDERLKIILTVRADFEPQFRRGPLEKHWQAGRCTVPPFTVDEFRQAIIGPIQQEAFIFESAENENGEKKKEIVDEIIEEVVQAAGALPLLSYTLSEIYNAYVADKDKRHREFKRKYYKDLGGVMGALHNKADNVYNSLKQSKEQQTMKKVMLRMVSLEGDMAGRRVSDDELKYAAARETGSVKKIRKLLVEERLIVRGKDFIEPAHDALVRSWVTLRDWIDSAGKERLLLFDKVRTATLDARQTGKLWDNDPRLESLKTELDSQDSLLNLQEVEFIKKSLARKQKRARNRRLITAGVMAALSVLTVWALFNAQRANREANRLRADILAIAAKDVLATDNTKALRLAEAAYHIVQDDPLPTVQNILSEAFHTLREKRAFYSARFAHAGEVTAAVFVPDGQSILTASRDGTAKLWNKAGKVGSVFSHDSVPIKLAAFSPESKMILTGAEDGVVKLWNMAGTKRGSLTHQKNIYSAVFSADGKYILTACADDTARLWNLQDNSIVRMAHDDEVFSAVFSRDGSKILTASADSTARIWDLSGNPVDTLAGHQKQVNSAIFSADGKLVLTAARDGMARLWDTQGTLRATLDHTVDQDDLFRAIFSQDGRKILTASADSTAILWDIAGNPLDTLNHSGAVYTAHFSRDGRNILTASADSTARLWDAHGNLLAIFTHSNAVTNTVFSPDGQMALTASKDGMAKLWNLQNTGTRDFDKRGHIAAFSHEGERILTVSDDHVAKFWDAQNGSVDSLELGARTERAVFSPVNNHLFTTSDDGVARLWNWRQKRMVDSLAHPEFEITAACFSPDGKQLLAIGDDGRARIWRIDEKIINRTTPVVLAPGSEITSADFSSPDGQRIITASPDGYARIWRQTGTQLDSLDHDGDEVMSAFFSSVTGYVLTAVTEDSVRLWDGRGRVSDSLPVDEIDSAVLSHDGRHVLIILSDGPVKVWHPQSQKIDSLIHPENALVSQAVFSPKDRQILTAASDGVARLWNLNGDLLAEFGKPDIDELASAEFSPDGRRILTRSIFGHVRLWRTPRAIFDWLKQAEVYRLTDAEKVRYKLK